MTKAIPAKSQATISSFFPKSPSGPKERSKRRSSAIDLTISDHENENKDLYSDYPAKKSKISDGSEVNRNLAESSRIAQASTNTPGSAMDEFRFSSGVPTKDNLIDGIEASQEERLKNSTRRELFKRKILEADNIFTRQQPDNEEAAAQSDMDDTDIALESPKRRTSEKILETSSRPKFESRSMAQSKQKEEVGPAGLAYTPLEKQIRKLNAKYPDTMLMVEVGYKYRFFGEDAKIASKELGIVCFLNRNFMTASIPVHRRDIHLKKLLSLGYKVGIVGQLETAALKKASDNRSGPFERDLTHLYTAATYVAELDNVDDSSFSNEGVTPSIVSLTEKARGGVGADEKVIISMIAVTPSTGDVIWDEFDDGFMRSELETRLVHIKPSEILLPSESLSKATEKMLQQCSLPSVQDNAGPTRIRIERTQSSIDYSEATDLLTNFYTKRKELASIHFNSGKLLATIMNLSSGVTIALAYTLKHLTSFGLADVLSRTDFFFKFTERHFMLLNANTLLNLEIYHNQTDFKTKGSLLWILDKTKTSFGARLLRSWIGRPLINIEALKIRTDAVEEILMIELTRAREFLAKGRELLQGLPDLARGLCRIQYGKCTPKELAILLRAFDKIGKTYDLFEKPEDVGFESSILNEILFVLPKLKEPMRKILGSINLKKASEDKRTELWIDPEKYSGVSDAQMAIMMIETELEDELKNIRKVLKKPAAKWATVAGEEYLIEIKKDERRDIPIDWMVVSSTKYFRRYHTPFVREKLQERAQYQETLVGEANAAYLSFLQEIAEEFYTPLRNAVDKLATLDCFFSMATVASMFEYCRPTFIDDGLEIIDGRHPMIEVLRSDPFVSNSIRLGGSNTFAKIITGPNMGGKSSVVRMVALIALMAQIGSYVPATSVKMGLIDAILTRMGASDEIFRGRSTFMVEMSETSDILRLASPRSLVILDELGRGTSTFDGMAIANAVLEFIVRNVGCKTLFITHYPLIAAEMERIFPASVSNLHMAFSEESSIDGSTIIAFLYKLKAGIASGSFGIECARLAGLPDKVVGNSVVKSAEIRTAVEERRCINSIRKSVESIRKVLSSKEHAEYTDHIRLIRTALKTSAKI